MGTQHFILFIRSINSYQLLSVGGKRPARLNWIRGRKAPRCKSTLYLLPLVPTCYKCDQSPISEEEKTHMRNVSTWTMFSHYSSRMYYNIDKISLDALLPLASESSLYIINWSIFDLSSSSLLHLIVSSERPLRGTTRNKTTSKLFSAYICFD